MALSKTDLNNLNLISSSKYDIYSKLIAIASNYTDIENVDFLKTGLFGYATESMAAIARDSSVHKSMLYNELFLNTAIMPKSIYNWAKMFNINITSATPAYTYATIKILIDDLESNCGSASEWDDTSFSKYGNDLKEVNGATEDNSIKILILDKSNEFTAGEYTFLLEHSLIVYYKPSNNSWIVKRCDTETNITTSLEVYNSKFIKSSIQTIDGKKYLVFDVRIYQYKVLNIIKQITSSSILNRKIHNFEFNDEFVSASLDYTKNGITTPIELRFSQIDTTTSEDDESETYFAYYNLTDSKELEIKFSNTTSNFAPSVNSTLNVKIITTKGAKGNITYTDDVLFRLNDEKRRNLPFVVNFSENYNYMSLGGVDSPSLNKIKSTIIKQISTRDVIVTENDLNNYFESLIEKVNSSNIGGISFVKKRDDILRRIFSSYILLRDGMAADGSISTSSNYLSKLIPTNTIDATFSLKDSTSLPFGTKLALRDGTSDVYEYVTTSTNDYYIVPFYTRVILSPFKKVKYLYNLTEDSSNLTYKKISQTTGNGILTPVSVEVTREANSSGLAQEFYTFTFIFTSNFNMRKEYSNTGNQLALSFLSNTGSTTIGTQDFSYSVNNIEGDIESIQSEDNSNIFTNTIKLSVDVNSDEFSFDTNSATLDYGTFLKLDTTTATNVPENIKLSLMFTNFKVTTSEGKSDSFTSEFESTESLSMFKSLDGIMSSNIDIDTTTYYYKKLSANATGALRVIASGTPGNTEILASTVNGNCPDTVVADDYVEYIADGFKIINNLKIYDIPVIHNSYFDNAGNVSDKQKKFVTTMFTFIDMLTDNLSKLETNTFFDMKFYNTYGNSRIHNTIQTDVNLELDVYLSINYSYNETLETEIRDYIRRVIDNFNAYETIKVSEIIKQTLIQFPDEIDHIDFKGLNGTFSQYIKRLSSYNKNEITPEYLNIPEKYLTSIKVKEYNGN